MSIAIPGLPEGVECIGIRRAGPDEFELRSSGGQHYLSKGPRKDSVTQIVVRPLPGCEFQEEGNHPGSYLIVKVFNPPQLIAVDGRFGFKNSIQREAFDRLIEQLKSLNSCVSVDVNEFEPAAPVKHFDAIVEKTRL